jgi:hypothetical protein
MTAQEWISAFCDEIDKVAPTEAEMEAILRLAAVAAHASERIAAPVACYVAGASGRPLEELIGMAESLGSGG